MTNGEKAREIAKNNYQYYYSIYEVYDSQKECERSALEMAEWKDQQFKALHNPAYSIGFADGRRLGIDETKQQLKEYLEKKKQEAQYYNATVISTAIGSIINELFEED